MNPYLAADSNNATSPFLWMKGVRRDGSQRFDDGPASVATRPIAGRFCAWRGLSDRRYVASIYPVDLGSDDAGLPEFEGFVVIAVARTGMGRRILDVITIERAGDMKSARRTALAGTVDEWHVHLLCDDRASRAAMVADLQARHVDVAMAARCA